MAETSLFIKQLISDLERGRIRIPSFQRGFVWNSEQVAYFIDSIPVERFETEERKNVATVF